MNNCRLLHLILLLSFAPSSPGCQTSPSPPLNTTPQSGPINVVFWLDTGLLDEEREKAEDSIFTLAKKECTRLATGLEEAKVLPYVSVLTEHGYGKNIHVPGYDTPKKVCFRLDPQFLADRDRSVCDCERDIGQALLRSLGELEKMKEFRLRHSSAALRPDSPQRGVVVAWFGGNNISVSPAETKRSA